MQGAGRGALLLLGAMWIVLGLSKLMWPAGLGAYLGGLLGVDSESIARALAITVASVELLIGGAAVVSAIVPQSRSLVRVSVALSAGVSLAVLAFLIVRGQENTECGCFGHILKATYGRRLVAASSILFVSIALLNAIWVPREHKTGGTK